MNYLNGFYLYSITQGARVYPLVVIKVKIFYVCVFMYVSTMSSIINLSHAEGLKFGRGYSKVGPDAFQASDFSFFGI